MTEKPHDMSFETYSIALKNELTQATEAHSLTTQRLSEASQKNNELEVKYEALYAEHRRLDELWDSTAMENATLQSKLDLATKRLGKYGELEGLVRLVHDRDVPCWSGCSICEALKALQSITPDREEDV